MNKGKIDFIFKSQIGAWDLITYHFDLQTLKRLEDDSWKKQRIPPWVWNTRKTAKLADYTDRIVEINYTRSRNPQLKCAQIVYCTLWIQCKKTQCSHNLGCYECDSKCSKYQRYNYEFFLCLFSFPLISLIYVCIFTILSRSFYTPTTPQTHMNNDFSLNSLFLFTPAAKKYFRSAQLGSS